MGPQLRIATLEREHLDAASVLLARAMDDDAAYRYLLPDPRRRRAGLTRLFRGNLRIHLPYRCTRVALDARGAVVGTVTVRPPGGVHISPLTMLRHGVGPFVALHGVGALRRLLWLKETYDAFEHELADRGPHWHVHMMATAPELQGRGVGSALLTAALARVDARPVVLTTHSARNVVFYRRAGFEARFERAAQPARSAAYTVWGMVRARAPS